ncbi:MAG: LLM class F420-dependent oxidoreductase [Acidimicrobiales bacterium]|nr:LLM class F420-dependent oxidoreductase [Acidimicrobiales bacterium]
MEFGLHLPDAGQLATREAMLAYARTAEETGYASLWSSDHIAWPDPANLASKYPYAEDNSGFPPPNSPWLDCIASLQFVAAVTEKVRLGTTVLIIGYRGALQQAKAWATLDHLSGGRAILGVGVGWMKEEFEAIGMPWDRRGERADETLEIFDALWTQESVTFDGPFTSFGPVGFSPKPAQGRIPVWVGGHTPAAFRRTAKYGTAFHSAFSSVERLREEWDGVRRACESIGRDPATVELTMLCTLLFDATTDKQGIICGSDQQVIDQLAAYAELGVGHTVVFVQARGGLEGRLEAIRRFASDVAPHIG